MKQKIAVLFGGCSSEYGVSLQSAGSVIRHMDRSRFTPVLVGITPDGDWYHVCAGAEEIEADRWQGNGCVPACLSPSRSRHELLVFRSSGVERIPIDAVLPVLHGKHGEDGTVQGLCELADIPIVGCGTLASALCMDKDRAHKLVSLCGIRVPGSVLCYRGCEAADAALQAEQLGWPLFVKPVRAGSSYGVARVSTPLQLETALEAAFRYDDEVLLEEAIPGFEVGVAVVEGAYLMTGVPDEIELAEGFFDFRAKYGEGGARIHTPARISREMAARVQEAAKAVFRALDCRGFARVDFFLTPDGELVFNEVNTIPGFTSHSRFPAMMRASGWSLEMLITHLIETAVGQ